MRELDELGSEEEIDVGAAVLEHPRVPAVAVGAAVAAPVVASPGAGLSDLGLPMAPVGTSVGPVAVPAGGGGADSDDELAQLEAMMG